MKLRWVIYPLISLVALQGVALPGAIAATPSAKPKPKVSAVKKVIAPKKVVTKKKITPAKKKPVIRKYVRPAPVRKVVLPSPSPHWPPAGFTSVGTAYARVPTGVQLIGILSALKNSSTPTNSCAVDPKNPSAPAFSCAAILVGSTQRCTWWKISSTITGIDPANPPGRIPLGDFTKIVSGAAAKTIQTIILISPVPLATGVKFTALHALCGIGTTSETIPSTSFVPAPVPSPIPSDTPSITPSPTNT